MKKIILLFVTFITFISNTYGLDINSKNAVMYNLNDNTVVFEKNKDQETSIASLTKIMTVLVAIENISDYDKNEIKINYNGIEKLNYGMKKDTKIGYIDISYKNKIYIKVDVVLDEDVNFSLINFIKNNIITISIFIIILLFVIKMY